MITATLEQEIASSTNSNGEESDASTDESSSHERKEMPVYSGLSALIQAATSQLGQSPSLENSNDNNPSNVENYNMTYLEGEAQGSIVPQDGKELSFPELLMTLLLDPKNMDTITFLPDGIYFAMRTKAFSEGAMRERFQLNSIDAFLEQIQGWGFTRICGNEDESITGIQVFRHPCFKCGDVNGLKALKFGQNPTEARMSAIPENLRSIQLSMSEDSGSSSIKRRLSPSHTEQETEDSLQKAQRVYEADKVNGPTDLPIVRTSSSGNDSEASQSRRRSSTEIRSYALAVTTAELDIQSGDSEDGNESSKPATDGKASLVEGGVERATHTIVTDAIETLLFDEGHTRETYLKHEKELSKSSLPGVVPISKQLFSPSEGVANAIASETSKQDEMAKENKGIVN
jgi:hypothetical protein